MTTATAERELIIPIIESPSPHPRQESVRLTSLIYENKEFLFAREMPVTITWDGEAWIYESKENEIIGFDEDQRGADFAFRQDFSVCWENFACEDDGNLSIDAREMKANLKSLVAEARCFE
jgi:hypothetical protein